MIYNYRVSFWNVPKYYRLQYFGASIPPNARAFKKIYIKRRNKKMKKKLLASLLTIALCLGLIAGSTYALFTSEDAVNIAVSSGKVKVTATVDELTTYSMGEATAENGVFENRGTAVLDKSSATDTLTLTHITPGDKITFRIDLVNESNVTIQYRLVWVVDGELSTALVAKAGATLESATAIVNNKTEWTKWDIPTDETKTQTIWVSIELPVDYETQGESGNISFKIEAAQGNANMPDEWDGTTPTEKPDSLVVDTDAKLISINSSEAFAYLDTLLNDGNFVDNYGSKWQYTVELNKDIDLANLAWTPIYLSNVVAFKGNGHIISNLNVAVDGNNVGLFGSISCNDLGHMDVENFTIAGATVSGKQNVGVVAGNGPAAFKNITVIDATVNAEKYVGGFVGRGSSFINCSIKDSTVTATDKTIGGLVGYSVGDPTAATVTGNVVENVTVTGAYNVGGMLGQAQNVTVEGNTVKNVTVISTKILPADASSNEVRTAEVAARSAFDNTTIGANTVENVTLENKPDLWDGTTPTEKPDSLVVDTDAKLISINSAEAFAYLDTLLNDGNFLANYGSKWQYTVELNVDIDLANLAWTPIYLSNVVAFKGNGHIISNLNVAVDGNNVGLFGNISCNDLGYMDVENFTIAGATVSGKQNVGVVAGNGSVTFKNITVIDATVNAEKYVGGIAGRGASFINCSIKDSTVTATNKTIGGLVGYSIGDPTAATVTGNVVENVTVTGTYNVGGMLGQAQNANVDGNTVKKVTVTSTTALPADADANEVRTAEVAARSAFDTTTIGANTVENVTLQNN